MNRYINITLLIVLILSFTKVISQDRKNYNLLWEIQHKNSTNKSYLFGTLHVKDSRAFKFSDSVIPAIKNSEIFALEINPDSINKDFSEKYYSEKSENVLKEILTKEEYKKLKNRYYEINNQDLDSIKIKHPQFIKSGLTYIKRKSDDRRTFLDAYLYGIAYNSEKQITGLEEFEDQIPSIENLDLKELKKGILSTLNTKPEELDYQIEELIKLYFEGDIEKIYQYIENSQKEDKITINRNTVMVNSLEKIMQNNTIFAAVGAAHLPGKNGMLALLKNKGFTIRKVNATFNDNDEQYNITPNLERWHANINESLGFNVLTPVKPIQLDISEKFKMMSSNDLIFGATFAYMAMDLRSEILKEDHNFTESIIERQLTLTTDSIISRKNFVKDSIDFTEIVIQKQKAVSRMQIVFANKIAYVFFTESSLAEVKSPYADAFFNSINVFKPKIEPSVWQSKSDILGAYSVDIPEPEKDVSREIPNENGEIESPYILNIFSAEDKAENMIYIFRYNDQPLGYYLENKEDYNSYFNDYFKENGSLVKNQKEIILDGVEGIEYEILFSEKKHTIARVFLRGNRIYLIMAQKSTENEKVSDDDRFLKSFKFLPYANSTFDTIVKIDDRYSFKAPSKKIIVKENEYDATFEYFNEKNYSSIDLSSSGTYLVQKVKLKPYARYKSLQAFYDYYSEVLTEYNDTIISNVETTLSGKPAREIFIKNSKTNVAQRMKLLLNDDTVILLLVYGGKEEINDARVDTFFNSLEITKSSNNFNLSASKADLIFKNLKSKDSIKVEEAQGAISYYQFDASEYKTLEKNLKYHFKNDTTYYGEKYYIINALAKLEKPETLNIFSDFYKDEKNSFESRVEILEQLPKLKNNEALKTYFDLLQNYKLKRNFKKDYDIMTSLVDTIPLFVTNDATFAKLAAIDDYRPEITSIYSYNVMEDSIYADKMPLLKQKLLETMYKDVSLYIDSIIRKKHPYLNNNLIYSYIEFSKGFDNTNQDVVKTLKLISEKVEDDKWLQTQALITATGLNIDIDPKTLNDGLKDLYVRFELMESLAKAEKTSLIPEAYLEPQEFAKLSLYNSVGGEYDGYPEFFSFLGEITVEKNNYYVFSFSYSEEDLESEIEENYLGIVEKKDVDFSNFEMSNTYIHWGTPEEDWKAQATNIILENTKSTDSELE